MRALRRWGIGGDRACRLRRVRSSIAGGDTSKGDGMAGLLMVELVDGDRGGKGVIRRDCVMFKDGGVRLKLHSSEMDWVGRLLGDGAQS